MQADSWIPIGPALSVRVADCPPRIDRQRSEFARFTPDQSQVLVAVNFAEHQGEAIRNPCWRGSLNDIDTGQYILAQSTG
jgi:hypothetical protein